MSKEEEVRWDMFEEAVRVVIEKRIDTTKLFIKEIRWKVFFQYLRDKLTEKASTNENLKEMIESPETRTRVLYNGPVVHKEKWLEYSREYLSISP